MKTIWKFPLGMSRLTVSMPEGAKILSAQFNGGRVTLWALVDTDAFKELRTFVTYGTGHPITDNDMEFIGTIQELTIMGVLVWHVFEVK